MQFGVVVEDVRQVENLEFLGAQRPELGQRWGQHLYRAQLQRFHFFLVLVQLAVREHLHLHATLGALFGQLLEVFGGLAFWGVLCHDVAEFDHEVGGVGEAGEAEGGADHKGCVFQFHLVTLLLFVVLCVLSSVSDKRTVHQINSSSRNGG
ncbi:hypothetical protein D3C85_1525580 [compost metagenome]